MINTVDPGGGGLMIDVERINSQLSLSHEKASVDLGGLKINVEKISSQLSPLCEKAIASVDSGGD